MLKNHMRTVSNAYFFAFYKACLQLGVSPRDIEPLVPGGLKTLGNKDIRYPIGCITALLKTAEEKIPDKAIGIHVGKNLKPADFREVGHAIAFAENLRQSISLNMRYQPLTQQFGRSSLVVEDGLAWLNWHIDGDPEDCRQVTESVISSHTQFGRWLIWQYDKTIHSIHFRHKKPVYAEEYEDFFGCAVYYDQDVDAMVFDESALTYELPQHNPELLEEILVQLDSELMLMVSTGSISMRLSQLIEALIVNGSIEIDVVAKQIGFSERTLRRRLAEENITYRQLVSNTRKHLCERYMKSGTKNFKQISKSLAYSDASVFTRAFRKWYGKSPIEYAKDNNIYIPKEKPRKKPKNLDQVFAQLHG